MVNIISQKQTVERFRLFGSFRNHYNCFSIVGVFIYYHFLFLFFKLKGKHEHRYGEDYHKDAKNEKT